MLSNIRSVPNILMFKTFILITISFESSFAANLAMAAERAAPLSDYNREDARLNSAYKALLNKLNNKERGKLVLAQKSWIKFRDFECDYESSFGYKAKDIKTLRQQCLSNITALRVDQLNNQLQCPGVEGDVTC